MKKISCIVLCILMLITLFAGCSSDGGKNPDLDESKEVELTVAGAWTEFQAIESVAASFNKKYPNCKVNYEYVQNYQESMLTRLESDDSGIDLFLTTNIQANSPYYPYAYDLLSQSDKLDLSGAFDGLIQNFKLKKENPNDPDQLYALPMGAELRGTYVNKTLLSSLGLEVPKNREEFMSACAKLLENGYIPIQSNPGMMGQTMFYPYICNIIANAADYDGVYKTVNERASGVSENFREPLSVLYELVEKGYYNYKYVENTYGTFVDASDDATCRYFFNIEGEDGAYEKVDDVGRVAFMPATMSLGNTLAKTCEDYHSKIEYEFILTPVGENGGYAYMSPAHGIAVNKDSKNIDWALEFLDFLFTPKVSEEFGADYNVIPNTKDAFDLINKDFDIPKDHISQLGSVTFDYNFYALMNDSLVEIAKSNNPKYMIDNGDETYTMYDFEHFMDNLKERFNSGDY